MKSFKIIFAAALLFSGFNLAFAQAVEPIKTDDVLTFKVITLNSVGQGFSDGAQSSDSAVVKIDTVSGDRTYTTSGQSIVLRKSKLFGTLQRNKYVFANDEVGDILPEKISIGSKWTEVVYFNSNRCGRIKNEMEVSLNEGPDVVVKVKGIPVTLKTVEIIREGFWYTTRCGGSGKMYRKNLYSTQLGEMVHQEHRSYDRGVLYSGEKTILESVN